MKKSFYLMAALIVAMTGCQKEPQANEGLSSDDKVYMEFRIQALTTRSATDSETDDKYGSSDADPDTEIGQDYENTISSVNVVLRNTDTYICANVASPKQGDNTSTWVAEFESSKLSTNTEYEVYVYANCAAKQDLDATSNAAITDMTQNNNFWMTNAYTAEKKSFTKFSTNKETPTYIGEVYVERCMARFDYMPHTAYTLAEDADGKPTVQVTLTEAALINQSNNFYLLRRVSTSGTYEENWTIGGAEQKNNYVVDTDYADKNDGYAAADADNFTAHLSTPANWTFEALPTTAGTPDKWEGKDDGKTDENANKAHDLNQYYIWKYAKENTIPGINNQVNGLSTGVVFKGELSGTNVPTGENAKEPIYVFDNVLYGTWVQVKEAAETNETLKFYTDKFGDTIEDEEYKELGKAGFTAYKPAADGKYYAYYYYWNRHNDNGDNQGMGTMEFAVVRNNVYKLCVDYINKFGHPDPTDDNPVDPDPVDPTDPDEQGEYYFKVTVKVLPWVVRVNHIGW